GIRDRTVTGVQTCALPIYFPSIFNMTAKSLFRIREPPSFYRARAAAKPLFRNGDLYLQFVPSIYAFPRSRLTTSTCGCAANHRQIGRASCRERVENGVVVV